MGFRRSSARELCYVPVDHPMAPALAVYILVADKQGQVAQRSGAWSIYVIVFYFEERNAGVRSDVSPSVLRASCPRVLKVSRSQCTTANLSSMASCSSLAGAWGGGQEAGMCGVKVESK